MVCGTPRGGGSDPTALIGRSADQSPALTTCQSVLGKDLTRKNCIAPDEQVSTLHDISVRMCENGMCCEALYIVNAITTMLPMKQQKDYLLTMKINLYPAEDEHYRICRTCDKNIFCHFHQLPNQAVSLEKGPIFVRFAPCELRLATSYLFLSFISTRQTHQIK